LLVYAGYLNTANKKIDCGGGVLASSRRLKQLARSQVGYICKTGFACFSLLDFNAILS
jgi:hypothetical protein